MKLTDKHGQQWQLVPIDPTESIERAYYWEQQKAGTRNCYPVYQAMLAAAPEPELSEGLDPIGYISAGGDVSRSKKYFDELGFVSEPLVLQSAALAALAEKDAEISAFRSAIESMRVSGGSSEFQAAFDRAKELLNV